MFSQYSQFDAAAAANILLHRPPPSPRPRQQMGMREAVSSRMERSTLLTLVVMVIVLLLVAIIIVATGLQAGFVWIILAGICIAWVLVCSCRNCKKITNLRLRRTSERSDTISTISDFNDLSYIGYPHPLPIDEAWGWAQDLPPSYDVVSDTLEQQPPSYASVMALINPTNSRQRIDISGSPTLPIPPPYIDSPSCTNVTISTATNHYSAGTNTGNSGNSEIITVNISRPSEELIQQNVLPSREHTCISIVSGCNLNENVQKITNINRPVIDFPESTPLSNDNQNILIHPAEIHIHTINCEPLGREHRGAC